MPPRALVLCVVFAVLAGCRPARELSLSHRDLACEGSCHKAYGDTPARERCQSCHQVVAASTQDGRGLHGHGEARTLPCGRCHTEHSAERIAGWNQSEEEFRTEHQRITGFALSAGHARPCGDCHKTLPDGRRSFLRASSACQSCHTRQPHGALRPSLACAKCHDSTSWNTTAAIRFDHDRDTGYPLHGQHQVVTCAGCHGPKLVFHLGTERASDCAGCHGARSPHGKSFAATPCRTCHTPAEAFSSPLPFEHEVQTGFALSGPHKRSCTSCHKPDRAVPAECAGCHKDPHQDRFRKFPACSTCHVPSRWSATAFQHGQHTRFPLTANHVAAGMAACRRCHRGTGPSDFEDLSTITLRGKALGVVADCVGCHQHKTVHKGQFPADRCLECHEVPGKEKMHSCLNRRGAPDKVCLKRLTWIGHGPENAFALRGGHDLARIGAKCRACHKDPGQPFTKIDSHCRSCHGDKDVHRGSLGAGCESCHDPESLTWRRIPHFDHQKTAFPLEGNHQQVVCQSCHKSSAPARRFKPPVLCGDSQCHLKDDAHEKQRGLRCGLSGCHDPRQGSFSPNERKGAKK